MTDETASQNEATIRTYFACLQRSDADAALEYYADDLSYWVCPGSDYSGEHGKAVMADVMLPKFFASQAAPIKFGIAAVTAQANRVHVLARGHMPLKDGGNFDNDYSWLFTLRDGKIVGVREFYAPY